MTHSLPTQWMVIFHTQENNTSPVPIKVQCLERGLSPSWPVPTTPSVLHPAGFITCLALEPLELAPLVFLPALPLPSNSLGNLPAFSAFVFLKEKKNKDTNTEKKKNNM